MFDEESEKLEIAKDGPDGTGDQPHPMGPWGQKPEADNE